MPKIASRLLSNRRPEANERSHNGEATMNEANRCATINRRDMIHLFAATAAVVAGAAVTKSFLTSIVGGAPMPASDAAHPGKGLATMTQDLATLAPEHFEPLVGETFNIGEFQVTLKGVRRNHNSGGRFRQQFALTFTAPSGVPIRSEVLPVAHPTLGRHDLLVTQIVDAVDGTALEICFS
jgi:hypothetical protein